MTLPLFINNKNKLFTGALMYATAYTLYYLTNHFPIATPVLLPMSWIDQNTPFLPWSVLIYVSEYIYFAFVFLLLKQNDNINKYLYSYFFTQLFAYIFFIFYPVTYPRELFPIPNDLPAWLISVWTWLRITDAPTNCLPSLHVASVFLSAFAFITDKQMKLFWTFLIWSILIAFSTLTSKQHYLIDIITGVILGMFSFWWFHYKQKYVKV